MSILSQYVTPVTEWLNANPHWAGMITFLISFSESLAIIGSIVPGSVTMTAIGILIGSGVIPATSTFIWAIMGAIVGDSASYYLGFYFKDKLTIIWPFSRHPYLLEAGKQFFENHGGKSVFIGRFLGPLRAVIPVIAGMMHMPNIKFLTANITSAVLWSFIYILPGVFIGRATSELSKELSTKVLIIVLIALILTWILITIIRYLVTKLLTYLNTHTMTLWGWLNKHISLRHFARFIADPTEPSSNVQLIYLISTLGCALLFIILAIILKTTTLFSNYNHYVLATLQMIRTQTLDQFLTIITFLGNKYFVLYLSTLIFIYFCARRYWYTALHWLSINLVAAGSIYTLKKFLAISRPNILIIAKSSSSFPSGHTTLAVAVLGFLCFLLSRPFSKTVRQSILLPSGLLIILVALSRLYLGAHWLSDIIGASLLALTLVFAHVLSYNRIADKKPLTIFDSTIGLIIFVFCWSSFSTLYFAKEIKTYERPHYKNLKYDTSNQING